MMANKSETALYRAPTFSLLLVSHGGISSCTVYIFTYELIPPCDARRREKVGALYSAVSGLLDVISRAYPQFLSSVPRNI